MKKYHPAAGTNLSELDTPVLFLDIEAVEKNYKAVGEKLLTYFEKTEEFEYCKSVFDILKN